MTLSEALNFFKKSVFSDEEIERYAPCEDGIVLITKSENEEFDDDDFIVGDVVHFLVRPNGIVELTTPVDCDFDDETVKSIR